MKKSKADQSDVVKICAVSMEDLYRSMARHGYEFECVGAPFFQKKKGKKFPRCRYEEAQYFSQRFRKVKE